MNCNFINSCLKFFMGVLFFTSLPVFATNNNLFPPENSITKPLFIWLDVNPILVSSILIVALLLTQTTALILSNQKKSEINKTQKILDIAQDGAELIVNVWFHEIENQTYKLMNFKFYSLTRALFDISSIYDTPQEKARVISATSILKYLQNYVKDNMKHKSYENFYIIGQDEINIASSCNMSIGKRNPFLKNHHDLLKKVWLGKVVVAPIIEKNKKP